MGSAHVFLAATNALERIEKIPPSFWLKVGIAIAAIIVVVVLLRKLLNVNKFLLGGAVFIFGGVFFLNMLYHRTEPAALTPLFNRLAPFFPSAGAYDAKQSTTPGGK
jgi:drug/metabolite transporter (DMT)-like permease